MALLSVFKNIFWKTSFTGVIYYLKLKYKRYKLRQFCHIYSENKDFEEK